MDIDVCGPLEIPALPHFSVTSSEDSVVIPIQKAEYELTGYNLPINLCKQLNQIRNNLQIIEDVSYMTIVHDGDFLARDNPESINLTCMLQPFIFSDARPNVRYEATVNFGIYVPDSLFSQRGLLNSNYLNPEDVLTKEANYVLESNKKCHSTVQISLSCCLPIHVFYTLLIKDLGKEIPQILIAKHVLIINKESDIGRQALRLSQTHDQNAKEEIKLSYNRLLSGYIPNYYTSFDPSSLYTLINDIISDASRVETIHNFWNGIYYFLVWEQSGCPQGDLNFGKNEYLRLAEESLFQPECNEKNRMNWATVAISSFIKRFCRELINWLGEL